MPLLIPVVIAALGGLFVGGQVDNAVQSAASKPSVIDNSRLPWYVMLAIYAVVGLIIFKIAKKYLK